MIIVALTVYSLMFFIANIIFGMSIYKRKTFLLSILWFISLPLLYFYPKTFFDIYNEITRHKIEYPARKPKK